jgi:hypothetical protein
VRAKAGKQDERLSSGPGAWLLAVALICGRHKPSSTFVVQCLEQTRFDSFASFCHAVVPARREIASCFTVSLFTGGTGVCAMKETLEHWDIGYDDWRNGTTQAGRQTVRVYNKATCTIVSVCMHQPRAMRVRHHTKGR